MDPTGHKPFQCKICSSRFARKDTLKRHSLNKHSALPLAYECLVCGMVFKKHSNLLEHRKNHADDSNFKKVATALAGTVQVYSRRLESGHIDINKVQKRVSSDALLTIQNELNNCLRTKVSLVMIFELAKQGPDGQFEDLVTVPFRSKAFEAVRYSDHREDLYVGFDQIKNVVDNFNENGSSWIILNILEVRLEISHCRPLNGSCGDISVIHPKKLQQIKLDSPNAPADCFYRAVAAHFVESDDERKILKFIRDHIVKLNHDPNTGVEVRQITQFEEKNPDLSLRINVLGEERFNGGSIFYPIKFSKNLSGENVINLILISTLRPGKDKTVEGMKKRVRRHYVLARDLSKLLRSTYGEGDESKKLTYQKTYPCMNCLVRFSSPRLLRKHEPFCMKNEPQAVKLCAPDAKIKFSRFMTKFKHPFVGFLDMESKSADTEKKCRSCENDADCPHKSIVKKQQTPISYCLIILDINDKVIFDRSYVGEDCIEDLDRTLRKARKLLGKRIENKKPLVMSYQDEQKFRAAQNCHICEEPFNSASRKETKEQLQERNEEADLVWAEKLQKVTSVIPSENFEEDVIVRDHCHIRGHFIGAAHQACNLNRRLKSTMAVPIYCHNFSGILRTFNRAG